MTRPRRDDSARVSIGLKVTEMQAAQIDAARGSLPRAEWCRKAVAAALASRAMHPSAQAAPDQEQPATVTQLRHPNTEGLPSQPAQDIQHDHRAEAFDSMSGQFPCGCTAEDL